MKSFILQLLIIIVIFQGVTMYRQANMLDSDTEAAPNFTLLDVSYQPQHLLAKNGQQTVVYFFAPWCTVCRYSMGNLQDIYEDNDDINIVAVALDFANKTAVDDFILDLQLTMPVLLGNEQVKQAYQISAYPSYYVLSPQHTIEYRSMGYSTQIGLMMRIN
ncbi:TlpA family protein disulfide reductase [Thalassotalea maritima]|uniref:TlpA family protein disulfide reductase n=1 Tax=Thalassotalea maritima TaxID=3242416 RepID=UPI00352787FD